MRRVAAVCSGLALSAALPMFSQYTPVQISSVRGLAASFARNGVKTNNCTGQAGLACAIPNLYGPYGLVLPNPTHAAHFESNFQSNFSALNDAIATQLTLLPLPSPASGFTFHFDPTTGLSVRTAESFGPILTERPETIGRNRFYFGFAYQRFRFNKLDDQPLHDLPVVFTHQPDTGPGHVPEPYESQFVSSSNSIDLKINQYTFFATYGVTSRIDLSVAVPILQIGMNVTSNATIERTFNTEPKIVNGQFQACCSKGPPYAHYFDPANPAGSLTHTFANNQFSPDIYTNPAKIDNLYWDPSRNNAAGFGDVVFRFKGDVYRTERFNLAFLTDIRFPTGDEKQFLGSGAYGVRPFVAMSMRTGHFSPHVNLGYQWNGSSILAGSILTGTKAHLPGSASFAGGVDIGVTRFLTAVADYIGLEVINAPRIQSATYTSTLPLASTGQVGTFSTINTVKETYNQSSGSFGVKANLFKQFLLTANILVALNNGGLRERVIPLVGASYTF
jgi:hypothetical protein